MLCILLPLTICKFCQWSELPRTKAHSSLFCLRQVDKVFQSPHGSNHFIFGFIRLQVGADLQINLHHLYSLESLANHPLDFNDATDAVCGQFYSIDSLRLIEIAFNGVIAGIKDFEIAKV